MTIRELKILLRRNNNKVDGAVLKSEVQKINVVSFIFLSVSE